MLKPQVGAPQHFFADLRQDGAQVGGALLELGQEFLNALVLIGEGEDGVGHGEGVRSLFRNNAKFPVVYC